MRLSCGRAGVCCQTEQYQDRAYHWDFWGSSIILRPLFTASYTVTCTIGKRFLIANPAASASSYVAKESLVCRSTWSRNGPFSGGLPCPIRSSAGSSEEARFFVILISAIVLTLFQSKPRQF